MKRFSLMVLAAVMVLGIMCGCSSKKEDDSLERILDQKRFVIGIDADNLPLSYRSGDNYEGFDVEMATEVCKRLDVSPVFIPTEQEDALNALDSGKIDCYWSYNAPPRTVMAKALFAEPMYKRSQAILVKKASGITEIIGLKGKYIGVETGSVAEQAVTEATVLASSVAECRKYESFDKLSAALASEEIDAAIVDNIYAKYAFISKYPSTYTLLDTALSTTDCRMAFRKKDSSLKNKVFSTLDVMQADSTLEKISQKWFGEDITQGIRFNIKTVSGE